MIIIQLLPLANMRPLVSSQMVSGVRPSPAMLYAVTFIVRSPTVIVRDSPTLIDAVPSGRSAIVFALLSRIAFASTATSVGSVSIGR